jgi:hypothetical protein
MLPRDHFVSRFHSRYHSYRYRQNQPIYFCCPWQPFLIFSIKVCSFSHVKWETLRKVLLFFNNINASLQNELSVKCFGQHLAPFARIMFSSIKISCLASFLILTNFWPDLPQIKQRKWDCPVVDIGRAIFFSSVWIYFRLADNVVSFDFEFNVLFDCFVSFGFRISR